MSEKYFIEENNGYVCRDDGNDVSKVLFDEQQLCEELNTLQKRVDELEDMLARKHANLLNWERENHDLRASISKAVEEIEHKMGEWDGYARTGYTMLDALDILRKHGLVKDK